MFLIFFLFYIYFYYFTFWYTKTQSKYYQDQNTKIVFFLILVCKVVLQKSLFLFQFITI